MSIEALQYSRYLFPVDLPPIVHHYTSHEGLISIIKSKSIWASNIRYLNDSRELDLAVDVLRECLRARRIGAQPWQAQIIDLVEQTWLRHFYARSRIFIFTVSLSEARDLLSQWRGYSPAGGGYSLGFDTRVLREAGAVQDFILGRCVYTDAEHAGAIQEVVDYHLGRLGPMPEIPEGEYWPQRVAHQMFRGFLARAPLLKHPAFSAEREWRLIGAPLSPAFPRIEHRARGMLILPYATV